MNGLLETPAAFYTCFHHATNQDSGPETTEVSTFKTVFLLRYEKATFISDRHMEGHLTTSEIKTHLSLSLFVCINQCNILKSAAMKSQSSK